MCSVPGAAFATEVQNPFKRNGPATPVTRQSAPVLSPAQKTQATATPAAIALKPGAATGSVAPEKTPETVAQVAAETPAAAVTPRSVLEQNRAQCNTSLLGPLVHQIEAGESELTVRLVTNAGKNCLTAVSSDEPGVDVQMNRFSGEIRLLVEKNPQTVPRAFWVRMVAGEQSFKIKIRQAGAPLPPVAMPSAPSASTDASAGVRSPVAPQPSGAAGVAAPSALQP